MPESLIVIGKIAFIPKEAVSPDHLAKQIGNGATVLLIEGYDGGRRIRYAGAFQFAAFILGV